LSRNKGSKIFLFIVLIAILLILPFGMVHARDTDKNVLILNSYHRGYLWRDNIIKGTSVNNIPFTIASINSYIFNNVEMRKFHIRKSMLPEDSIIINAPSTSIELSKNTIYTVVITFIAILALINFMLMINISQRKAAEKSVEEERNILKSILDSTGDGMLVVTKETREVLHVNDSFKKMWNIPEEIFSANSDSQNIQFVKPQLKDPNSFEILLDEIMLEDKNRFDTLELNDGRIFELFFRPLIISGKSTGQVWSFRDITKKRSAEVMEKELELQHKLLEEAHNYDILRTHFFSIISHEFKTPLNIILGVIQLMNINHETISTCPYYEARTRHMNMMKQNCYRLLKLINNLIDITKIDSGFLSVNLKNLQIIGVIEDITLSVAEYAEYLGVTLIFDTDMEERIMACDPDKLERIMLNLLSNAMKFTEKGGTIKVSIYNKQDHIIITVKDTGVGIPNDMKNTIFERFRQVDSSLARKKEGSGIGLSLVKMLVDAHGGSISVNSKIGIGSKFVLKLPALILEDEQSKEEVISKNYMVNVEKIMAEFSDIYS